MRARNLVGPSLAFALFCACSSSSSPTTTSAMDSGSGSSTSAQTPPMGQAALVPWLATGEYKKWHCESAPHAARSPSPHGFDRVCSNDLIATNATGTSDWPKGAAAVKEIYDSLTDKSIVGYAVYLKTEADSAGGANWYFYESEPETGAASKDFTPTPTNGIVADGLGSSGTAKSICVACHMAAGSDAAHTPVPGGRDEVYTPVH
jgi:hypothetical protein